MVGGLGWYKICLSAKHKIEQDTFERLRYTDRVFDVASIYRKNKHTTLLYTGNGFNLP